MANTHDSTKRFAGTLTGVVKASERLAIGNEIVGLIDGWAEAARQLQLDGADGLVAHVKLQAKCEAAREIMEMIADRGLRDIGGLSS